jgi:hypothetical protein
MSYRWLGFLGSNDLSPLQYTSPCPVSISLTGNTQENPRKWKGKQHTNYHRSEDVTTAIEKNPGKDLPAMVFF